MFKSITYKRHDVATGVHIYTLDDSEFGNVNLTIPTLDRKRFPTWITIWIVREYSKKNKDVGKNLALACLAFTDQVSLSALQEECAQAHIDNWEKHRASRDEWLQKLLLIS